ncbi:glycosyltransferase [Paenibacillus hodogayensis]|uniref:Glycosyltransferase n=1 Tax=Paenibacillus hodogayensis TaxID=279208 RepID=A0ABV5VSW7_9BACL
MNILLEGIFYNGHGLAEGNRILLRFLDQAGYQVRIAARDRQEKNLVLTPQETRYISSFEHTELSSHDLYLYNGVGSHVRHRPEFCVNIARTTFETDRIPAFWVPELNKFDEVWVQSSFNLRSFRASGVNVPLRLIPNFFDMSLYEPRGPALKLPVSEPFIFLSVFDLKERKGYDVLLEAYLNEFSAADHVALVVKIRDHTKSDKVEELIARHPKPARDRPSVYVIDQMLTTSEMLGLYRASDAFVLPTRGEGWGRPFFEAMLMELPCIGTDWSGQTDFMHGENSFLVAVERFRQIANHENDMFNGHYWAEPSISDLQRNMRMVLKRKVEAKRKGRTARAELLEKYAMPKTAAKVVAEIAKYATRIREVNEARWQTTSNLLPYRSLVSDM